MTIYSPETERTFSYWQLDDELEIIYDEKGRTLLMVDPKDEPPNEDLSPRKATQKDKQKLIRLLFSLMLTRD